MSLTKLLLIVCLAVGVFQLHQKWKTHAKMKADENGFVSLPLLDGAPPRKVVIIAPLSCPKPAGRAADALERALAQAGVPCVRSNQVSFSSATESDGPLLEKVMNGPLPIVFVRGRAKNAPDAAEVIREYTSVAAK